MHKKLVPHLIKLEIRKEEKYDKIQERNSKRHLNVSRGSEEK